MEALATKTVGELALQGSGWAVAMLFLVGVIALWRRNNELTGEIRQLAEAAIATAESSKAAIEAHTGAVERMQSAQEKATDALQETSEEAANEIRETRHAVTNHHTGVNAVVELLVRRGLGAA